MSFAAKPLMTAELMAGLGFDQPGGRRIERHRAEVGELVHRTRFQRAYARAGGKFQRRVDGSATVDCALEDRARIGNDPVLEAGGQPYGVTSAVPLAPPAMIVPRVGDRAGPTLDPNVP